MNKDQFIEMERELSRIDKKEWRKLQTDVTLQPLDAHANIESLLKAKKIKRSLTLDDIDKIKREPSKGIRLLYSLASNQKEWFNELLVDL